MSGDTPVSVGTGACQDRTEERAALLRLAKDDVEPFRASGADIAASCEPRHRVLISEAAAIGAFDDLRGSVIRCRAVLRAETERAGTEPTPHLVDELIRQVGEEVDPIAWPSRPGIVADRLRMRSGIIMRMASLGAAEERRVNRGPLTPMPDQSVRAWR